MNMGKNSSQTENRGNIVALSLLGARTLAIANVIGKAKLGLN